jgi:hypothetical protein
MPADSLTLDRDLIERFIVEVDGVACFDIIRNGRQETSLAAQIYEALGKFEEAAFGEQSEELHRRGWKRGRELARELIDIEGPGDAR